MKRYSLGILLLCVFLLTGCGCEHVWTDATCTQPKTCSKCGETEGSISEHVWIEATCTKPKTCSACNAIEGEVAPHKWAAATCTVPKTCSVCNKIDGSTAPHMWLDATCTTPQTCSACKAITGSANGHSWINATCTTAKTCNICKAIEGDALGHNVSAWDVVQAATCSADGEQTASCSVCKEVFIEKIPQLDHQPSDWKVTKKATLDESGTKVKACASCGVTLEEETFALTGEEWEAAYKKACKKYSYSDIARYPEKYKGEKAKFTGKVVQVVESKLLSWVCYTMRVNITKTSYSYKDTIYVTYIANEGDGRILEDDIITMYGTLEGTKTYETVLGSSVTIPKFSAEIITQ